ncbi:hypothetical protein D3C73_1291260 [compost metagenome]
MGFPAAKVFSVDSTADVVATTVGSAGAVACGMVEASGLVVASGLVESSGLVDGDAG